MLRTRVAAALALALVLAPGIARAAEVAGVDFPERLEVGPQHTALVLSGAGLRRAFGFKVYAVGLYLRARAPDGEAAIAAPGPKRVAIEMLRNVDATDYVSNFEKGLRANHDEAAMRALAPSIARFEAIISALEVIRTGTRIWLDLAPGGGTVVWIDGAVRGAPIAEPAFYPAVLRSWLGAKPVQEGLKRDLLGAE